MNIFIFYSIWIFTILTSIKCKVKDKPRDILDQFHYWDINNSPKVLSKYCFLVNNINYILVVNIGDMSGWL